MTSAVSICLVYPDLLGTYGDGGNATVLLRRLEWRGINVELKPVELGEDVPTGCDIYLLGGGEDQPQVLVTERLSETKVLHKAASDGAVIFGVCAGMQILGNKFPGAEGKIKPGLGLIDIDSVRGDGPRRVGELATRAQTPTGPVEYTGYENHQGISFLGDGIEPLATVISGVGNDDGKGTEGAISGRIITTYMHGPALVRNPQLADRLLEMAVGETLSPLDDAEIEAFRKERLAEATRRGSKLETQGAGLLSRLRRRIPLL